MAMFWKMFVEKWTMPALPITTRDLTGRTVIVTGSNIGLGLEAAKHFYQMNPKRLILAVRSIEKGETAKEVIQSSGGKPMDTKIEVWKLDLSSFESTKAFATKVNTELHRLDVFLANAGVASAQWNTTKDGWEASLQTNVLSTFLLASLLIPILKKTAKLPSPVSNIHLKPHLVIVSSGIHKMAHFPERSTSHIFSTLNDKDVWNKDDRYPVTKILEIFLTRELAHSAELENGDVIVCTVCPGFCRSELMRETPMVVRMIMYALFARTTEEGSRPFLWASLVDEIPLGSYTASCKAENPSPLVESSEGTQVQKQLWIELRDILTKMAPGTENVWNTVSQ